jgi:hypothetical protein
VHRSKWVLESIFGKPPPPPPADVLPDHQGSSAPDGQKMSLRAKLEAHREPPAALPVTARSIRSASRLRPLRHRRPLRTVENVSDGEGANPTIDASGELPDGRTFADADEARRNCWSRRPRPFHRRLQRNSRPHPLRRGMTADRKLLTEVAITEQSPGLPPGNADPRPRAQRSLFRSADMFSSESDSLLHHRATEATEKNLSLCGLCGEYLCLSCLFADGSGMKASLLYLALLVR